MKQRLLHLSGGGVKGVAHVALVQGLGTTDFQVISGISIGAVLAVPIALGKLASLQKIFYNVTHKTFFKVSPVGKKGNLTAQAISRALTGKDFGDQSNLWKLYIQEVNEDDFKMFLDKGIQVYVGYVDMSDKRLHVVDINKGSYGDMVEAIYASASMPVFTEPVNDTWVDGGLACHNLCHRVNQRHAKPGDISISSWTRPQFEDRFYKDPGQVLGRQIPIIRQVIDTMGYFISKHDEEDNAEFCEQNGVINLQAFHPNILEDAYDVDHGRVMNLYRTAFRTGKSMSNGISTEI